MAGAWRSLVRFPTIVAEPPTEILRGTMRLFLASADGASSTAIRACRAAQPWSEPSVTWATQPAPAQPCSATTVGFAPQYYEWTVTDVLIGANEQSWQNLGLAVQNANESGLVNERAFHSRHSAFATLRPELVVRYVPAVRGARARFSADGQTFAISVVPELEEFDGVVFGLEFFFREQTPAWLSAEPLAGPAGWTVEESAELCDDGAPSGVLRFRTPDRPLRQNASGEFTLRIEPRENIPTEIVQLQLTGAGGVPLGKLAASRADTPTPTPSATATPSPTLVEHCCEFAIGCLSASLLTRESCEAEGGSFVAGGTCDLETGRCTGGVPVATRTATRTHTASPTHTPAATPTATTTRTPTRTPTVVPCTVTLSETALDYLPENSNTTSHTATLTAVAPGEIPAADVVLFQLLDISTYRGDAMNRGHGLSPDLEFRQADQTDTNVQVLDPRTAQTRAAASSATIVTRALDYGARGRIAASACEMSALPRRIPRDTDADTLPDAWESANGFNPVNADSDGDGTRDGEEDDDANPAVAGNPVLGRSGDGLVAFEEYRGFFVGGAHRRADPRRKDLFAHSTVTDGLGNALGLGFLPNSPLTVHAIRATEWSGATSRVINFNRTGIPAATPQRALRVIEDNTLGDLGLTDVTGIDTGPDGIADTMAAGGSDDVQVIAVGQGQPNAVTVEAGADGRLAVPLAGDDGRAGQTVVAGPNGVAETTALGDDVQTQAVGTTGLAADAQVVGPGPNGILDPPLAGDDVLDAANNRITAGADGVADTAAAGDDVQVIPVGQGEPHAVAIAPGPNYRVNTAAAGDDVAHWAPGSGPLAAGAVDSTPNETDVCRVDVSAHDAVHDGLDEIAGNADDVDLTDAGLAGGALAARRALRANVIRETIAHEAGHGHSLDHYTGAGGGHAAPWSVMLTPVVNPVPATYDAADQTQIRLHRKHN